MSTTEGQHTTNKQRPQTISHRTSKLLSVPKSLPCIQCKHTMGHPTAGRKATVITQETWTPITLNPEPTDPSSTFLTPVVLDISTDTYRKGKNQGTESRHT